MKPSVIAAGYGRLAVGACLAEAGNQVTGADVDAPKIEGPTLNVLPIYEPGLEDLVERNQAAGRRRFTTEVGQAIAESEVVVFIAVGTPPDEDGSADLRHVLAVAETIGRHMAREMVVVTKSTVPEQALRRPVIVDGRNLYALHRMAELGFVYHSIGRPPVGEAVGGSAPMSRS